MYQPVKEAHKNLFYNRNYQEFNQIASKVETNVTMAFITFETTSLFFIVPVF